MFYDNFVKACNSRNKAPSAVAIDIGISKATVTGWKNGSTPNDATLQKLADYFGISPEDLTGSNGPSQKRSPAVEPNSDTQNEGQLMAAFFEGGQDLSEEEMAALWQDAKDYIQWKLSQRRKAKDDQ